MNEEGGKNPTNIDSEGQSWQVGTTVWPGGGFKGTEGRDIDGERDRAFPSCQQHHGSR